jgi:UDP-N-acetylmuramate--alanine ligase
MNPYYLIAVAGTHGKTTTTAMMTDIFEALEKDPTSIIGSFRSTTKSNYRAGKSKYAIVEACEFKRDFLHLKPDVLVITNIEHEHVDYYQDLEDVQKAFKELVGQVNEGGVVIANTSDANVAPVLTDLKVPVENYLSALDLDLKLKQPGFHNRLNAAAALAVARHEKLDLELAKTALENFNGTWRRFEYKGELNGAPVIDDYAHHPTEIRSTVQAARELFPERRLVIVFQPHTYTRTKSLFDEFAKAVGLADEVIFLPIYAAREKNASGVTSRELSVKALEYSSNSSYVENFESAEKTLRSKITDTDMVVVMGAGDVTNLATSLVK